MGVSEIFVCGVFLSLLVVVVWFGLEGLLPYGDFPFIFPTALMVPAGFLFWVRYGTWAYHMGGA